MYKETKFIEFELFDQVNNRSIYFDVRFPAHIEHFEMARTLRAALNPELYMGGPVSAGFMGSGEHKFTGESISLGMTAFHSDYYESYQGGPCRYQGVLHERDSVKFYLPYKDHLTGALNSSDDFGLILTVFTDTDNCQLKAPFAI